MLGLKQKILTGAPIVGTWLNSGSPIVAELMAACGFDFICVDAEHSAVDLPDAQRLFQAIQSGNPNCTQFVRLHGVDYAFTKRYLDAGARGVIGPLVRNRAEAALLVEAVKYPPLGNRGVGFCRANQYGINLKAEFDQANDLNLVGVQIEHIDAVNNIDEILSVSGVDFAFIGPYDLSASMGLTAQFDHPAFIEAKRKILAACAKHKVIAGQHIVQPDPDALKRALDEGYRFLAYSLDITMLTHACKTGMKQINAMRQALTA